MDWEDLIPSQKMSKKIQQRKESEPKNYRLLLSSGLWMSICSSRFYFAAGMRCICVCVVLMEMEDKMFSFA
jgi:hypothetical protein